MPNKIIQRLKARIEDAGCYNSKDFISFSREFKKMMNAELKKVNGENLKMNTGHYYVSGFFTVDEQVWYFSISDVRYFPEETIHNGMLIRTAKDYKDYTGGQNQYIRIEPDMFVKFFNNARLYNWL